MAYFLFEIFFVYWIELKLRDLPQLQHEYATISYFDIHWRELSDALPDLLPPHQKKKEKKC